MNRTERELVARLVHEQTQLLAKMLTMLLAQIRTVEEIVTLLEEHERDERARERATWPEQSNERDALLRQ